MAVIQEGFKEKIKEIIHSDKISDRLCYLYERWQDEKAYEDFNDYADDIKETIATVKGVRFHKGTKRPFGFQAYVFGRLFQFSVAAKGKYLGFNCKYIG